MPNRPHISVTEILAWVDAHLLRTGRLPDCNSGVIRDGPGLTWRTVDVALNAGRRGLPGGSSLARLLAAERGHRHKHECQRLTPALILAWATAFHERTGEWPNENSGPVEDAPGETWSGVNGALCVGTRGLPGGDSLGKLLARRLGVRNKTNIPRLTIRQIRRWAREHRGRTGRWPSVYSGEVLGAPGELWRWIDANLRHGHRGLPPGGSLAELLREMRAEPAKVGPKPRRQG